MIPLPRLLIAEYSPTRVGVRLALDQDVEICAEVTGVGEAVLAAAREQPELCIVGIDIPGGGIAAVKGIVKVAPRAAVIVLAGISNARDLLASVRAGAVGYVPGGAGGDELRSVVRAVLAHEAAVPRSMVRGLMLELQTAVARGSGGPTLRETQVLNLLQRGHDTRAIAQELGISPVTVRRHISELLSKLGASDREALISLEARPDRVTEVPDWRMSARIPAR